MAAQNRSLDGVDLVLWHTLGVTHIPRCEDWPCMPVEHASFFLKPANFFDVNPGINLPPGARPDCQPALQLRAYCSMRNTEESQQD